MLLLGYVGPGLHPGILEHEGWLAVRDSTGRIVRWLPPQTKVSPPFGAVSPEDQAAAGNDAGNVVVWKNGWRTLDGLWASPQGRGLPGAAAEKAVWEAILKYKGSQGWQVITGRVSVRDDTGQLRVYDGVAIAPSGRVVGLEVKSGTAQKNRAQREFDARLNERRENVATSVGRRSGLEVNRAVEIRVDDSE